MCAILPRRWRKLAYSKDTWKSKAATSQSLEIADNAMFMKQMSHTCCTQQPGVIMVKMVETP
jgi:hypothetical protein